jgi:hypothetical protein
MDNYGMHGAPEVSAWLKKHPRFVIHYVPTSSSRLNLIERWFAELTNKQIRRGSFFSVEELVTDIHYFLDEWHEKPRPFVWTATVDSILAKLARFLHLPVGLLKVPISLPILPQHAQIMTAKALRFAEATLRERFPFSITWFQ